MEGAKLRRTSPKFAWLPNMPNFAEHMGVFFVTDLGVCNARETLLERFSRRAQIFVTHGFGAKTLKNSGGASGLAKLKYMYLM